MLCAIGVTVWRRLIADARGKASMELEASTFFPTSPIASSSDTVELFCPPASAVAKLAVAFRPIVAVVIDTLQPDHRADLSPSQSVERKLSTMTKSVAIPVSHFRHNKTCRRP
jgi:hypothetical protein